MANLAMADIQIFMYKETGKYFAAVACGNPTSPDYILDLDKNKRITNEDVTYESTFLSLEKFTENVEDSLISFDWRTRYGTTSGTKYYRLHNVRIDFDGNELWVPCDNDYEYYADDDHTGEIVGKYEITNPAINDGESITVEYEGNQYWTHIGYAVTHDNVTIFQKAIQAAEEMNQPAKPPTTKQDNSTMSVVQKGSEIATNMMQVNKDGLSVVAKMTTGGTALQIAINRIEQLVPQDKRQQFKLYANTPLGKLAVANLLSVAQGQFMANNDKAKYIADGAIISAMAEVAQALPIQQIVIDLFSGINVPEIQG